MNSHKFESTDEEDSLLIYNYNATYTGLAGATMIQKYFFPY